MHYSCANFLYFFDIIAATKKVKTEEKKENKVEAGTASMQQTSPAKDTAVVLTGNVNSY